MESLIIGRNNKKLSNGFFASYKNNTFILGWLDKMFKTSNNQVNEVIHHIFRFYVIFLVFNDKKQTKPN